MKKHISSLEELKDIEKEPLVSLYTKKDEDDTFELDTQVWSGLLITNSDRPYLKSLLSMSESGDLFSDLPTGYFIHYLPNLSFKVSIENVVNLETSDNNRMWGTITTQKKRVITLEDLFDPHIFTDLELYSKDIKDKYIDFIKLIFKKIPKRKSSKSYDCYIGQSPEQDVLDEFKELNKIMPYTFMRPYDECRK